MAESTHPPADATSLRTTDPGLADRTEALVRAAQRHEPDAIDRLIAAHLADLRAFVRLRLDPAVRARESHADIVQSICREVLEDLPGFEYRGPQSFRAWLFTAALNKVRQKHEYHFAEKRDPGREARPTLDGEALPADLYACVCSPDPSPSEQAVGIETAEQIEAALDRLPPDYREVLVLSRLLGLSHAEIGDRMDRSALAIRTLLCRATVRLLALLERRDPASDSPA